MLNNNVTIPMYRYCAPLRSITSKTFKIYEYTIPKIKAAIVPAIHPSIVFLGLTLLK